MAPTETAKRCLEHGAKYPYDAPDAWRDDAGMAPPAAADWAHRAARGILSDLSDRRGVKWALQEVGEDVRAELVGSLAGIIRLAAAERKVDQIKERMEDALQRISDWAQAYPLSMFPEPDFALAAKVLEGAGISLGNIGASNMRHVITQVQAIATAALAGKATSG